MQFTSTSLYFSQRNTMFTCAARSDWVVQPSEQQIDQTQLAVPRLDFYTGHFFPSNAFLSCEMTMLPFLIFNELTNIMNCLAVSTRRFSQQFLYIIQQQQTKKKNAQACMSYCGIQRQKRNMMQCCFYN